MDALQSLLGRNSQPRLQAPAPSAKVRDLAVEAALRAPDHGWLKPWRFVWLQGQDLFELGERLVQAQPELNEQGQQKCRQGVQRAPAILMAVATLKPHRVPEIEQIMAAGVALSYAQLAFHAQGFASVWRTGEWAYHDSVLAALGLAANERLVGYLYVGTAEGEPKALPSLNVADFLQVGWS